MDCAIVLHTFDRYRFLWPGWDYYFRRHWDFSIPARIYFLNEDADISFSYVTQIKTGAGEWSNRLIRGLSQIPELHVFYLQEDFWPIAPLPRKLFEKAFHLFVSRGWDAFRIIPRGNYRLRPTLHFLNGQNVKRFHNRTSLYLVSHQPGFWRKDFFQTCLVPGETPWQNEMDGTERIRSREPAVYMVENGWYAEVCRKGELTDAGKAMIAAALVIS